MASSRTLRLIAPALVVCLLGVGAFAGSAAAATAPASWSKQVCGASASLLTKLDGATDKAVGGSIDDAKDAKKALVKLLTTAKVATAAAEAKIKKAGAPKAPNGKQVAGFAKEAFG